MDMTATWVLKDGFKDERDKRYYYKWPRRWSLVEGIPNPRVSHPNAPPTWHGEVMSDSSGLQSQPNSTVSSGNKDFVPYWVARDGFADERSGRYYMKRPRRLSVLEGVPSARVSQKNVPATWHGEVMSDSSLLASQPNSTVSSGNKDLVPYWVHRDGFKDERSGTYYTKRPRRWSFLEGVPSARVSQKNVPASWHGEVTRDGSVVESSGSKNCFAAIYRWFKGLTLLKKILLVGFIITIITIISGIVIHNALTKNKNLTAKTGQVPWLPVWPWQNENFPDYCVTTDRKLYIYVYCHGLVRLPNFASRIDTMLNAIMTDNTWEAIEGNMFANFPNLKVIDLASNGIIYLSIDAFKRRSDVGNSNGLQNDTDVANKNTFLPLSDIERIRLSNNKIVNLHKNTFNGLSKLYELWLDHNSISNLSPVLFQDLRELTYIHLEYNKLAQIHSGTFIDVKHGAGNIILANNKIHHIAKDSFAPSASLRVLDLRNNPLTCDALAQVPEDIEFKHIPTVDSCNLSTPSTPDGSNVDDCQDDPCPADAMCEDILDGFICLTVEPQEPTKSTAKRSIKLLPLISVAALLFIVVCMWVYSAARRRKKADVKDNKTAH